ncbi:hypothetical protein O6H91_20G046100 [Diphasiastrum complanatum]|uniref:Uncharacterized protein n=1 Tax=Diphasiastrum complanatum TaxID=34168 RepID=A0ACC2APU5_DIPCM|nr:hypothetical protein O6H91_20G046100 [Diphasiastrum complanatum]
MPVKGTLSRKELEYRGKINEAGVRNSSIPGTSSQRTWSGQVEAGQLHSNDVMDSQTLQRLGSEAELTASSSVIKADPTYGREGNAASFRADSEIVAQPMSSPVDDAALTRSLSEIASEPTSRRRDDAAPFKQANALDFQQECVHGNDASRPRSATVDSQRVYRRAEAPTGNFNGIDSQPVYRRRDDGIATRPRSATAVVSTRPREEEESQSRIGIRKIVQTIESPEEQAGKLKRATRITPTIKPREEEADPSRIPNSRITRTMEPREEKVAGQSRIPNRRITAEPREEEAGPSNIANRRVAPSIEQSSEEAPAQSRIANRRSTQTMESREEEADPSRIPNKRITQTIEPGEEEAAGQFRIANTSRTTQTMESREEEAAGHSRIPNRSITAEPREEEASPSRIANRRSTQTIEPREEEADQFRVSNRRISQTREVREEEGGQSRRITTPIESQRDEAGQFPSPDSSPISPPEHSPPGNEAGKLQIRMQLRNLPGDQSERLRSQSLNFQALGPRRDDSEGEPSRRLRSQSMSTHPTIHSHEDADSQRSRGHQLSLQQVKSRGDELGRPRSRTVPTQKPHHSDALPLSFPQQEQQLQAQAQPETFQRSRSNQWHAGHPGSTQEEAASSGQQETSLHDEHNDLHCAHRSGWLDIAKSYETLAAPRANQSFDPSEEVDPQPPPAPLSAAGARLKRSDSPLSFGMTRFTEGDPAVDSPIIPHDQDDLRPIQGIVRPSHGRISSSKFSSEHQRPDASSYGGAVEVNPSTPNTTPAHRKPDPKSPPWEDKEPWLSAASSMFEHNNEEAIEHVVVKDMEEFQRVKIKDDARTTSENGVSCYKRRLRATILQDQQPRPAGKKRVYRTVIVNYTYHTDPQLPNNVFLKMRHPEIDLQLCEMVDWQLAGLSYVYIYKIKHKFLVYITDPRLKATVNIRKPPQRDAVIRSLSSNISHHWDEQHIVHIRVKFTVGLKGAPTQNPEVSLLSVAAGERSKARPATTVVDQSGATHVTQSSQFLITPTNTATSLVGQPHTTPCKTSDEPLIAVTASNFAEQTGGSSPGEYEAMETGNIDHSADQKSTSPATAIPDTDPSAPPPSDIDPPTSSPGSSQTGEHKHEPMVENTQSSGSSHPKKHQMEARFDLAAGEAEESKDGEEGALKQTEKESGAGFSPSGSRELSDPRSPSPSPGPKGYWIRAWSWKSLNTVTSVAKNMALCYVPIRRRRIRRPRDHPA